ncbi:MAG: protein kinase, partial [Gemmataceae bacterium]|nr:protein kinase [Gemmataceae bacterium]
MTAPRSTAEYEYHAVPVEDVVYDFEKAFRAGTTPNLETFLVGDGPDRWQLLVELAHSELELRLRVGQPARLSDYLERFPGLAHFPNELAALLVTEVKLRTQAGDGPDLKEYEARYAVLGPRVREAFRKIGAAPPEVPGYDVLDRIAAGGMGVVYRARQLLLQREVALKVIRRDRLAGGEAGDRFRARFRREAQAVAAVNHPNVVQVYDLGEAGGCPYFVMEFVEGGSLAGLLKGEGKLAAARAGGLVA